jgi:ribosomal protein S18 acetylase RimI-like enzyme
VVQPIAARQAGAADIPPLVDLMGEFYAEASVPLDRAWASRAFEGLLAQPHLGAAWLLERDGEAIGHVVLSVRFAMEFGGLIGYVDDLFVRPAARRAGAGTIALDAVTAECRRRGCRSLEVEVGAANVPAQALYRRHGLRPLDDDRQMLRLVFDDAQA